MNGVHDMGGMQHYGPVFPEIDEPRFHAPWERRALALTVAMGATGQWNIDQSRSARETLPAAQYLSSSYYRIWIEGLCKLLLERGLITPDELRDGVMREPAKAVRRLEAERAPAVLARGSPTERSAESIARFKVGDAVRTRNINPPAHTRLPRYCRGRAGAIAMVHGVHVLPDANATGKGEHPEWLYSVAFDAQELWGRDSSATSVHVDCWESYLEPR
jgi:nitrile hydratase beta subunit